MKNKFKIGIDARLFSQTGVGTYLRNLIYYLQKLETTHFTFYIYLLPSDFSLLSFSKKNFIKRSVNFFWHSFSEQIGFLKVLNKDNLDLMYFSYFSYPLLYQRSFFSTIHDLTPLFFKTGKASTKNFLVYQIKHLAFKIALFNQVRRSKVIITPSLFVKHELMKKFGKKYEEKILPLYEGVDYQLIEAKENRLLRSQFPFSFFLYVGNFYPHKNLERLILAYEKAQKNLPSLVLVGPDDFFRQRLIKRVKQLQLEKKIFFYQPKTAADLVFFYKNALALLHPSLSEGFGLPLIEASYFHCPVIASNIAVFQEIMENEYLSFDPKSSEDMIKKLNLFLKKRPKFNFEKINKKFSFEKMTRAWLKIVKQLIG